MLAQQTNRRAAGMRGPESPLSVKIECEGIEKLEIDSVLIKATLFIFSCFRSRL